MPVRNHLRQWQDKHGGPSEDTLSAFEKYPVDGEIINNLSKITNASTTEPLTDGERWIAGEDDGGDDLVTIGLFLKPGDVVELS